MNKYANLLSGCLFALLPVVGVLAHADTAVITGSITWHNKTQSPYQVKITSHSDCVISPDLAGHNVSQDGFQAYALSLDRNACDDGVWVVFSFFQLTLNHKIIAGSVKYIESLDSSLNLIAQVIPSINYPGAVRYDYFRSVCGVLPVSCIRPVKVGRTQVSITPIPTAALLPWLSKP